MSHRIEIGAYSFDCEITRYVYQAHDYRADNPDDFNGYEEIEFACHEIEWWDDHDEVVQVLEPGQSGFEELVERNNDGITSALLGIIERLRSAYEGD